MLSALVLAATAGATTTVYPANGSTDVPVNARILVLSSLSNTNPRVSVISSTNVAVPGAIQAVSYSWNVFTPAAPLAPRTTYNVQISGQYDSYAGSFTTGSGPDTTTALVVSTEPADGSVRVTEGTVIRLRFSKPLNPLTVGKMAIKFTAVNGYSNIGSAGASMGLDFDSINVTGGLSLATAYKLEFTTDGVTDWTGNQIGPIKPLSFSTYSSPPNDGPQLTGTAPSEGETSVPINSPVAVAFDRVLATLTAASSITFSSDGKAMPFTLDMVPGSRTVVLRPSLLLAPNQPYTVTVSGLTDTYGVPIAAPVSLHFVTGAVPDQGPLQVVSPTGSAVFPAGAPVKIRFNRPLDAALIDTVMAGPVNLPYPVRLAYDLSADRSVLRLNPETPLAPGVWTVRILLVYNRLSARRDESFTATFTVAADADPDPPTVQFSTPGDGAVDVPLSSALAIVFSKPVDFAAAPRDSVRLTRDGAPVPADFTWTATTAALRPKVPLAPVASYQLEVSGVANLAGLAVPDFRAAFTTAASNPVEAFQLLSAIPENGAMGVDPASSIVLTFNRDVSAVGAFNNFVLFTSAGKQVKGTLQVRGPVVIFTPTFPLQGGVFTAGFANAPGFSRLTDLAGTPLGGTARYSFTATAPAPDPAPFAVTSVSPADGQTVLPGDITVTWTFSKPVDASTVTPLNFQVIGPVTPYSSTPTPTALDDTHVSMRFTPGQAATYTLYLNPGLTDRDGNAVAPFRSTLQSASFALSSSAPGVVRHRPWYDFSVYDEQSISVPVALVFRNPMDRASVERGFLAESGPRAVDGSFRWTPDSQGLTFTPAAPYTVPNPNISANRIKIALMDPAKGANGQPLSFTSFDFSVGYAPNPQPLSPVVIADSRVGSFQNQPTDFALDLLFNADAPDAALDASRATFTSGATVVAATITRISARVIRIRPVALLQPGKQWLLSYKQPASPNEWQMGVATGAGPSSESPDVLAAGPVDQSTDVPLDSQLSVAFTEPAASLGDTRFIQLSADGGNAGGVDVPLHVTWNALHRGFQASPYGLLLPDTTYTVRLSGLQNAAAKPFPEHVWTFHTGTSVETRPFTLLRVEPSGSGVSTNAVLALTFNRPVAPDSVTGVTTFVRSDGTPGGALSFSSDLKTFYFKPARLAAGSTFNFQTGGYSDLSGNMIAEAWSGSSSFTTGFGDPGSLSVVAVSPSDGLTGVPVNTKIQATFTSAVLASSLTQVTFLKDGAPVPATVSLDTGGRTITIAPPAPLDNASTWTVVLTGVRDTAQNTLPDYQWNFQTGSHADTVKPASRALPFNGQRDVPLGARIILRFETPLNRVSVTPASFPLHRNGEGSLVTLSWSFLDGDTALVIKPATPLAPRTQYYAEFNFTDLAGNPAQGGIYFTTGDASSTGPAPAVSAVSPADGATGVPLSDGVQVKFNVPVDLPNAGVALTAGGVPVAVAITAADATTFQLKPVRPFTANQAYQLQISGAVDNFGNAMAAFTSGFTTGGAAPAVSSTLLISTSPKSGEVGVPVTSDIVLNFSAPPSPVAVAKFLVNSSGYPAAPVTGTWAVNGATATFHATIGLPGAAPIFVYSDWVGPTGSRLQFQVRFTTGARTDGSAPVVEWSYPSEGALVPVAGLVPIAVRFSKPVVVTGQRPIRVVAGSRNVESGSLVAAEDGRTILGDFSLPEDSDILIVFGDGVTDFAGTAAQPATIQFHTLTREQSIGPAVKSVSPPNGAIDVDPAAPISVTFTQSMDIASTNQAVHVLDAGKVASGALSHDDAAQTFQFQPDAPLGTGSAVSTVVEKTAASVTGFQMAAPFGSSFQTVKAAGTGAPQVVSFQASRTAIDLRFDRPVRCGELPVYLRTGRTLLPTSCREQGSHWLRVSPFSTLRPDGDYRLVVSAAEEVAIRPEVERGVPNLVRTTQLPGLVRLEFDGPVDSAGMIESLRATGRSSVRISLDRRTVFVIPNPQ